MEKGIGRQISHEVLEQYRFRAIKLRKKGWQVNQIAEAFGINRRAVTRWFTTFHRHGSKALKSKKANGPEPKLSQEDRRTILAIIRNPAIKYGFETSLWTCKRLQQIIKEQIKKEIDISNIWRWLKEWGLTNQKPDKEAIEKNKKEVRRWLNEEWPKIQEHCRRWRAMFYFQDESSVSLVPVLGKTWSIKGKTPKIRVTGNRGSIAVSSAISPAGRMVFRIKKDTVTAKSFIDFLKQMLKYHKRRKVIVIVDNSKPHIAQMVNNFVGENKSRLAVYYLPTYSPELNPDEEVWNYLKNVKLKAHQAKNKKEFTPLVRRKLRSIQKKPELIKSFFFMYGL